MAPQDAAYIVGIVVGSVAVLAAVWVWVKRQAFGVGGGTLCLVGFALLGLSIWTGFKISVSETGITAEFERLQARVDTVLQASQAVVEEVLTISNATEATQRGLTTLTRALARREIVSPGTAEAIADSSAAPAIDRAALENARRVLGRQVPRRIVPPGS